MKNYCPILADSNKDSLDHRKIDGRSSTGRLWKEETA